MVIIPFIEMISLIFKPDRVLVLYVNVDSVFLFVNLLRLRHWWFFSMGLSCWQMREFLFCELHFDILFISNFWSGEFYIFNNLYWINFRLNNLLRCNFIFRNYFFNIGRRCSCNNIIFSKYVTIVILVGIRKSFLILFILSTFQLFLNRFWL